MRIWTLAVLMASLAGCAYVSKDEFVDIWDADGDGWGREEDCNDKNGFMFPYAGDVRGDGCDADCGMEPDRDGDDWPDDADCEPDNAEVFPCNAAEKPNDGIDANCDGDDGTVQSVCNANIAGWRTNWGPDPDWAPSQYRPLDPAECTHDGDPIVNDLWDGTPPGTEEE